MTTDEMRKGFGSAAGRAAQVAAYHKALNVAADEIDRLQRIIDSRPAINAGLPETYIQWSQGVMQTDIARAEYEARGGKAWLVASLNRKRK